MLPNKCTFAFDRRNCVLLGSATGGHAAAIACTLTQPAKLTTIDPQTWRGTVLQLAYNRLAPRALRLSAGTARKLPVQLSRLDPLLLRVAVDRKAQQYLGLRDASVQSPLQNPRSVRPADVIFSLKRLH